MSCVYLIVFIEEITVSQRHLLTGEGEEGLGGGGGVRGQGHMVSVGGNLKNVIYTESFCLCVCLLIKDLCTLRGVRRRAGVH